LDCVDRVFDSPLGAGLGHGVGHRAFHADLPGRVDVWPVAEAEPEDDDPEWYDPVDRVSPGDAAVRLAGAVAAEIRRMKDAGVTIPEKNGRRALSEGDVLILVRGRGTLFDEIIRACKREGLEIAGADRLKLGGELAVRDLTALLSFLATPEDDLSLAALLRSPLFGWTEADLYDLAAGRDTTYLWTALRQSGHEETLAVLDDLRGLTDYLQPYELLDRMLVRHGGRPRLLARLGAEAEDGIDELLAQALSYERTDIPSLTGFLGWLQAGDVEVRRQAEGAGGRIRVMTVHGAKGLEAPVVILPDTMRDRNDPRAQVLCPPDGPPMWRMPKDGAPAALRAARDDLVRREDEERARLLYVAMTRAETWLIVCGAGDPRKTGTWHAAVDAAVAGLEPAVLDTPFGPGKRIEHGDWGAGEVRPAAATPEPVSALPGWIDRAAPTPRRADEPLSPSDLGGPKALPGEGLEAEAAMRRGTRLHKLLEHLPRYPSGDWPDLAPRLLAEGAELAPDETAALLDEARRVIQAPALAHLFAPGILAEVPLTARLAELGDRRIAGTVDLLLVERDRVLAVDFKSNRAIPDRPEDTPEGLSRQMGAYAAALAQIYPGRRIETAILWTGRARLMPLPADLVAAALGRAGAALTL
jgi:ATP-dependent helicase/nuclease subunit A